MIVAITGCLEDKHGSRRIAGAGKDEAAKALVEAGFVTVAFADIMKRFARDVYGFTETQLWGVSEERNRPDKRFLREHTWQKSKCVCCGIDARDYFDIPQCYLTPRYFLQILGTECGRHCFAETWVNKALEIAKELLKPEHKNFQGSNVLYSPQRGLIYSDCTNTSEATGEWYENELGDVRIPKPYVGYIGVIHPDARFKNEFSRVKEEGGTVIRVKRYVDEFPPSSIDSSHLSEREILEWGDDKFDHVILNDGTVEDLHRKVREAILR